MRESCSRFPFRRHRMSLKIGAHHVNKYPGSVGIVAGTGMRVGSINEKIENSVVTS